MLRRKIVDHIESLLMPSILTDEENHDTVLLNYYLELLVNYSLAKINTDFVFCQKYPVTFLIPEISLHVEYLF